MKNFSLKMKANYRHRSKKRLVVQFVIVASLVSILLFGAREILGYAVSFVTTPIYAARDWVSQSTAPLPSYLRNRTELLREMELLEEKLAAQSGQGASLKRLEAENTRLRALLNAEAEPRILAGVTGRPPYLPYDVMLIDRGSEDGVREGAAVYQSEDAVVGFVSRAYAQGALVTLFSTPGVNTTAYIYGPDVYATLYGEGGGVVRVSVPQGLTLSVGDVVVLPALESGIVGEITEVRSVPSEPEQHGFVVFETPLQSLHFVTVSTRVADAVTFAEAAEHVAASSPAAFIVDVPPAFRASNHASSTQATTSAEGVTATSSQPSE